MNASEEAVRWVRRTEGVAAREVEGEVVVLDVAARQYHALNRTGALLWHRLETSADAAELVRLLTEKYDVDADAAGADVTAFLTRLARLDLVREVSA